MAIHEVTSYLLTSYSNLLMIVIQSNCHRIVISSPIVFKLHPDGKSREFWLDILTSVDVMCRFSYIDERRYVMVPPSGNDC